MPSFNEATLIGNVGTINTKEFDNGKIVNISLATTERYTNREGEKTESTMWHNLCVFGKLADIADQYVERGDPLFVKGRIRYRKYTQRDGSDASVTEIVVTDLKLLARKERKSDPVLPAPQRAPAPQEEVDDLPF